MEERRILVVDDDKEIADLVEIHLIGDGYQVFKAYDAKEGLKILSEEEVDLAILDIMMPGIDGISLCKMIRQNHTMPIIMLSAKSSDLDKIVGLGAGADDYVIKPFNPLELTARVKSQLRRYTTFNPNSTNQGSLREVRLENISINKENHRVIAYEKEVKLTPIEFDILYLLASNPGKVYSTEEIFENVWNEKMYEANNTVMVHIRRLREKIELDSRNAQIIKTVWGVGYKIEK
ncbi:MAG: two-component system, OmpR family, response regulator VanR [Clostridiales bacterium]|nr:two-component system, OmpR family, response regulator VanR [Clostridiales bacterium]